VYFEWDEHKNQENIRKHGLDFGDAWEIFGGPLVPELDLIGNRVVVVTFTFGSDEAIRLISLRKALRHERKRFEEEI
jgi:uncharacterized DUF497 family protein